MLSRSPRKDCSEGGRKILSRSVNGVDPMTTLTVTSFFNSASRRNVVISGETDTSLVSKITDVVRGRSPSWSAVSMSSVAKPDREMSSSVESRDRPIESKRLVVTNTGGHFANCW